MAWYEILLVLLGTLIVLMALGLPVVFAFFATNLVGAYVFMGGENGILQLVRQPGLLCRGVAPMSDAGCDTGRARWILPSRNR
jgi:hypothetical protein